ncbi:MAG: hypothetical protein RIC89_06255, partial [Pseudomonadales bacterium]
MWQSPLGTRVNQIERQMMATALSRLHGERVLWIGQDATCANQLKRRLIKAPVFLSTHPLRAGGP